MLFRLTETYKGRGSSLTHLSMHHTGAERYQVCGILRAGNGSHRLNLNISQTPFAQPWKRAQVYGSTDVIQQKHEKTKALHKIRTKKKTNLSFCVNPLTARRLASFHRNNLGVSIVLTTESFDTMNRRQQQQAVATLTDDDIKTIHESEKCGVYFTAVWCPPCQRIGPFFQKLKETYVPMGFPMFKVDVDANAEFCATMTPDIGSIPDFRILSKGQMVAQQVGANERGWATQCEEQFKSLSLPQSQIPPIAPTATQTNGMPPRNTPTSYQSTTTQQPGVVRPPPLPFGAPPKVMPPAPKRAPPPQQSQQSHQYQPHSQQQPQQSLPRMQPPPSTTGAVFAAAAAPSAQTFAPPPIVAPPTRSAPPPSQAPQENKQPVSSPPPQASANQRSSAPTQPPSETPMNALQRKKQQQALFHQRQQQQQGKPLPHMMATQLDQRSPNKPPPKAYEY